MGVEAYEVIAHDWLSFEFAINDLATRVVGQEVHPISSPTFANSTITADLIVGGDLTLAGGLVLSGLEDGGICFINGSLEIDTDAANFTWDYTNKRLGIGTSSPSHLIEIASNDSYRVRFNVTGTDKRNLFEVLSTNELLGMQMASYGSTYPGSGAGINLATTAWATGFGDLVVYGNKTPTGGVVIISNNEEAVRIDGSGDVTVSNNLLVSSLTPGRVLFAGADGLITDDAGLTYNSGTDTLTAGTLTDGTLVITGGEIIAAASNLNVKSGGSDIQIRAYEDATHYAEWGWSKTGDYAKIVSVGGGMQFLTATDEIDFSSNNLTTLGNISGADITASGTGSFGDVGIGTNDPDKPLEIRNSAPVIRLRATGSYLNDAAPYVEFGGDNAGAWKRTGYVGDGISGDTDIYLRAEVSDLKLGDSTSDSVLTLSGGNVILAGTGEINFRDTDISIGSTLTDGILDMSADVAIDMFFDNADRGAEEDGQHLNINRRAAGDDYISLYVDKNRKGLIGFSGDDDLLQLAANVLTVNGDITASGTVQAEHLYSTDDLVIDGQTQLGADAFSTGNSVGIGIAPADDQKLFVKFGRSNYNPGNAITGFRVEARTGGSGTRGVASYAFQGVLTIGGTNTNSASNYAMYPQILIRDSGAKTGNAIGCYAKIRTVRGHSPTVAQVRGYYSELIADEGTFTDAVNYFAKTPTKSTGDIITFAHLWLEDVGAAPDTGYAIYSAGGQSVHAGNFRIGDNTAPTETFEVFGSSQFGDDTNEVQISSTGDITLVGTATVWNDMQFQISDAKVTPASLLPSWEAFTANTSEYAFSVNDEVDTSANEIPHSWKQGTVGDAHIHITTKAVNNTEITYAKFTVTFAYADVNEVWVEVPLTAELTIANPTAALTNFYLDLGDITLTNYLIETQMRCRVKRIAATTGTEYAGDIFITQVGVHFEEDTIGSGTERAK